MTVVENVLEHGDHKLANHDLHVCRPPPEETMMYEDEDEKFPTMTVPGNAVLVEGLESDIHKQMFEMFFESKKRSGGGDINQIRTYQKSGRAIIWFADPTSKL